jgi:hypothetical protein
MKEFLEDFLNAELEEVLILLEDLDNETSKNLDDKYSN